MEQYKNILEHVLKNGQIKTNRTGVRTISTFGYQTRFDLQKGFPLVTLKQTNFRLILTELLWFLRGNTNISWLNENNCKIWDEWADNNGDLGPIYGSQWRSWSTNKGEIDQIQEVVWKLKHKPDDRRIIVSAWNVGELEKMALPPCHLLFQFNVRGDYLDCLLYQRSCDLFLGVPFNIASYSLLTHMLAGTCGYLPGEFIWTGGDVHIYENHLDQVDELLNRTPKTLPQLILNKKENIDDYNFEDFSLRNYNPHPRIKAPVAV